MFIDAFLFLFQHAELRSVKQIYFTRKCPWFLSYTLVVSQQLFFYLGQQLFLGKLTINRQYGTTDI